MVQRLRSMQFLLRHFRCAFRNSDNCLLTHTAPYLVVSPKRHSAGKVSRLKPTVYREGYFWQATFVMLLWCGAILR